MVASEGAVCTDRAERYVEQLCGHLDHLRHVPAASHGQRSTPRILEPVQRDDGVATVAFDIGSLRMQATPGELRLLVEADEASDLDLLQALIAHRVTTIGRRDGLTITWQPVD